MTAAEKFESCMDRVKGSWELECGEDKYIDDEKFEKMAHEYCSTALVRIHENDSEKKQDLKK